MAWVRGVDVDRTSVGADWEWSVPVVATLESLSLDQPVTFLCGENGSGKVDDRRVARRGVRVPAHRRTRQPVVQRAQVRVRVAPPASMGTDQAGERLVLRAEMFFDVAATADAFQAEKTMAYDAAQLSADFDGESPLARSHGQGVLGLLRSRMEAQSLWFMDEPEAALSFRSALGLLAAMHDLVEAGSQLSSPRTPPCCWRCRAR